MTVQTARSDADHFIGWLPVLKIETIQADTAVNSDYLAIRPQTDVGVYYDDDPTNVFTISANDVFAIASWKTLKLNATTVCLIY